MPGRVDQTAAGSPLAASLLEARRGTAFFFRKMNELTDEELTKPSLIPGWSRAAVIAHVSLNGRALARLIEGLSAGTPSPMYDSLNDRKSAIDLAATLPSRALRNLFEHTAIHLSVEWRDLTAELWGSEIEAMGSLISTSALPTLRSKEVWLHAIDLNNGARAVELPTLYREAAQRPSETSRHPRRDFAHELDLNGVVPGLV